MYCFPRVKTVVDGDRWVDGSAFLAAAAAIMREPETRVNKDVPLKWYDGKHSIPSAIIPLEGITDIEYHVSSRNMESLLSVGGIVFQKYLKGFGVRIPMSHPMHTGQPFSFQVDE